MSREVDRKPLVWLRSGVRTDATIRGTSSDTARRERAVACRNLEKSGFAPLIPVGEGRIFEKGAVLLRQGGRSERFCIVVWGRLKAYFRDRGGRSLTLSLYGPGDVVGFAGALSGRSRRTSVRALHESGCLVVDRERLLVLLSKEPHLVGGLLPLLTLNLAGCTNCLVESMCHRVDARIARLFLSLLPASEHGEAEEGWIPLQLSRQELAELAGTTIETCSRVMSRFRAERIVITADDGFAVRDPDALRRVALS